jgi:hypothetical protein
LLSAHNSETSKKHLLASIRVVEAITRVGATLGSAGWRKRKNQKKKSPSQFNSRMRVGVSIQLILMKVLMFFMVTNVMNSASFDV